MFIKGKVRQRRQKRIKNIIEKHKGNGYVDEPYIGPIRNEIHDKRWEDPEYVWKRYGNRWDQYEGSAVSRHRKLQGSRLAVNQMKSKVFFSVILFAVIWVMFQLHHPWAEKGQNFIVTSLTEDFDFQEAALWYEKVFQGSPSFIPTFDKNKEVTNVSAQIGKNFFPPASGVIKVPFSSTAGGIHLETASQSEIVALETGRVIFVGESEQTGLTVVIQHANQLQSVYGWLGQTSLQANDWVEGGEQIGMVSQTPDNEKSLLYFAIKLENRYINPADVIAFD